MKFSIFVQYQTLTGELVEFHSSDLSSKQAMLVMEDLIKIGRAQQIDCVDQYQTSWTLKELKKYNTELEQEPQAITIYFDGGFDHKSGQAGLGCLIYYQQNHLSYRLRKNAIRDDLQSNNEAEYAALEFSLRELETLTVHHQSITIKGDAKVVLHQLSGEWASYDSVLNDWADRIEAILTQQFLKPDYQIIPRQENQQADQLASQALKGIPIEGLVELKEKKD